MPLHGIEGNKPPEIVALPRHANMLVARHLQDPGEVIQTVQEQFTIETSEFISSSGKTITIKGFDQEPHDDILNKQPTIVQCRDAVFHEVSPRTAKVFAIGTNFQLLNQRSA